ncbi:hypothetical protein FH972_025555 [Carpinus fangiana]|uniref:Enoyl reductase (ER) domain-containing protein n=1 Tax=Carpinus fangiana TaxID=176857 RepID=A0A5N6L1Y6_9ROSI|nr:hypothetical protein FH972_025555 [Carpinus fangiana]
MYMQAVHLPGLSAGEQPRYRFPDKGPAPEDLLFTSASYPRPEFERTAKLQTRYIVRVCATALTRGELTWIEVLQIGNFETHGGPIPGHDLVGIIDDVQYEPSVVPKFSKGDLVWGLISFDRNGAAAEYVMALEDELALAPFPPPDHAAENWNNTLATIPLSGLTAIQALFGHGGLKLSQLQSYNKSSQSRTVLILGAAGSVGVLTVQLAKLAGLNVVAACGERLNGFVKQNLEPDHILEHETILRTGLSVEMKPLSIPDVDLVIDCVGGEILKSTLLQQGCIRAGAKIVSIASPLTAYGDETVSLIEDTCRQRKTQFEFFIVEPNSVELDILGELLHNGKLRGYVEAVYTLQEARGAMKRIEEKTTSGKGKVVLEVYHT